MSTNTALSSHRQPAVLVALVALFLVGGLYWVFRPTLPGVLAGLGLSDYPWLLRVVRMQDTAFAFLAAWAILRHPVRGAQFLLPVWFCVLGLLTLAEVPWGAPVAIALVGIAVLAAVARPNQVMLRRCVLLAGALVIAARLHVSLGANS